MLQEIVNYLIQSYHCLNLTCKPNTMENRYWRPYKSEEEFQEEDVWGIMNTNEESSKTKHGLISRRLLPSAARMIPGMQTNRRSDERQSELMMQNNSAPVNVPDWSQIYGKSSTNNTNTKTEDDDDDEEEEEDEADRLPPHEWLAKKNSRSQVSSFSVCEGVGRTLKGRDLSRVRNAVLSKTGFL